jgi:hypothetical protein
MSGKIVRTTNITQSAIGNKDGLWTTVFSAAVFVNEETPVLDTGKSNGGDRAALQEEILRQSLSAQPDGMNSPSLAQRNERLRRPAAAESFPTSPKKSFP